VHPQSFDPLAWLPPARSPSWKLFLSAEVVCRQKVNRRPQPLTLEVVRLPSQVVFSALGPPGHHARPALPTHHHSVLRIVYEVVQTHVCISACSAVLAPRIGGVLFKFLSSPLSLLFSPPPASNTDSGRHLFSQPLSRRSLAFSFLLHPDPQSYLYFDRGNRLVISSSELPAHPCYPTPLLLHAIQSVSTFPCESFPVTPPTSPSAPVMSFPHRTCRDKVPRPHPQGSPFRSEKLKVISARNMGPACIMVTRRRSHLVGHEKSLRRQII
jgi:hypothetical protein